MSGLDMGILLLSLGGAFLGMKIGAVSALFNILAGVVGSWAAGRFYVVLSAYLPHPTLSYALLFLAVAGAFVAAGVLLSHLLSRFFLGLFDKFLGALLGIGLTLVLCAATLMPMLAEPGPAVRGMMRRSAFAPYVLRTAQKYARLATREMWEQVDPSLGSENLRRVRKLLEASR